MTQPVAPGIVFNERGPAEFNSLEGSRGTANPLAPQPRAAAAPGMTPEGGLDFDAIHAREAATKQARTDEAFDPEQAELEARHGQAETALTQFGRGALSALLTPGVLVGATAEAFGALTHTQALEEFGRDLGKASTGRSALEALGAGASVFTDDSATTMADRARIAVDEQERAWPLLSTVSQVGGSLAFGVATGGLAGGGAIGAKTLAAIGAYEGAGAGAQAAYDAGAPLADVWTSALIGGTVGAGLSYGGAKAVEGFGALAGKARQGLEKVFSEGEVLGEFGTGRVAKALGFSKRLQKKYGEEEVARIAHDIDNAHLADGTPVFPRNVLEAARMDKSDIAERIAQAHDEVGAQIGQLRQKASAFIDQAAPELRPRPGAIADRIETEIAHPLGASVSEADRNAAKYLLRTTQNLREMGEEVPLEAMVAARQRIGAELGDKFQSTGAQIDAMKRVYGIMQDDLAARFELAAERMGEPSAYRSLNRQYTSLERAAEAMEDAVAGAHGNNFLGLSSNVVMAGTLMGDIASGGINPLRVLAAGVGHKFLHERGPQVLAALTRSFRRTPAHVDVAVAGGREAQEALTEIVRARKFIQQAGGRAGPNPQVGAVAENTAHEAVNQELARRAGTFDPTTWASAPKAPNPLSRVLNRKEILDAVSSDLAQTVERSVAMRPGLDFDLDAGKLGRLTKDADGPAAIGAVQAKVREIAESGALPMADLPPDIRKVSSLGLENADHLKTGMRGESFARVREEFASGQPTRPVDVTMYPDGQIALNDGRHRLAVAKDLGLDRLPARVSVMDAEGNIIRETVGDVPIRASGPSIDIDAALQRLETADVAGAMAEAHALAKALKVVGAEADARDLSLLLSDDAFGSAGKLYGQMTAAPDDLLREMSNPAKLRDTLRTLELRGQLSSQIANEHRAAIGAWQARQKLTGEAMPEGLRKDMQAIESAWARGEESVTLDGARLGRVVDVLENTVENRVASKVPRVDAQQQVAETMKGALKNIEPALKPSLRKARVKSAAARGALTGAARLQQYEQRLDQLSRVAVQPNTDERTAAIGEAPPELRTTLATTTQDKVATLLRDMPKPSRDIHGPAYSSLSSEDIRRGNAMWEATMEPLSVFEDFARGDVDPDKVEYAWKQYPGLQQAAQMGVLDMLQSQMTPAERNALPDSTLTQLDFLLGFNGALQGTVSFEFSQRVSGYYDQLQQQQGAAPPPPSRGLMLPGAKPTMTQRIAGAQ